MINKKLKILSLFAGAGGMDLGFKNAGFDVVWANDFDPDSVKTYKRNFGDHIVLGDIEKIRTNNMPDNPSVVPTQFSRSPKRLRPPKALRAAKPIALANQGRQDSRFQLG